MESTESVLNVAVYREDNVCVHKLWIADLTVLTRLLGTRTLFVCLLSISDVFYHTIEIQILLTQKVKKGNMFKDLACLR